MPSSPPPPSAAGGGSAKGCVIPLVIVAVLMGIGIALVFSLYYFWKSNRKFESVEVPTRLYPPSAGPHSSAGENHTVIIQRSEVADYSPTQFGDELTAEHFIAVARAGDTTDLAKEAFVDAANGTRVEWMLRVEEIEKDGEDSITARFALPYEFRSGNSSSGSYYNVTAKFTSDSYPDLIEVRNGQWVRVSGILQLDDSLSQITFEDPALVKEGNQP